MTSAIPVLRSTNWANKLVGIWSLCWIQTKPSKWWIMAVNINMKIIHMHCSWKEEYRIDPRSYEHYWTSSWNKAWKRFRPVRDLNPWPLRYRCSALSTELTSQLGAGHYLPCRFGVGHDEERCNNGYIMASVVSDGENAFKWSNCSRTRIQEFLT